MVDEERIDAGEDPADQMARLRAENDALRDELARSEGSEGGRGWRRRWLSITFAVVLAALVPTSVVAVWASETILDEDRYVETVGELANREEVREKVSRDLSREVNEAIAFADLAEDVLPEELSLLAGPIANGLEGVVENAVARVVDSDQFRELWVAANRLAHNVVRVVVTGGSIPGIDSDEGEITLDLSGVLETASGAISGVVGDDLADRLDLSDVDAEIVLLQSDDLASVQSGLDLLDRLSWFVPLLALLLAVATVLFAEDRRRGVLRVGIALVASAVVALLLVAIARGRFLDAVLPENVDFAGAVFDTLLRFLRQSLRVVAMVGLLVTAGAWVVGPSGSAVTVRGWWQAGLGRAGRGDAEPGPAQVWVGRNEGMLLGIVLTLATISVLLWDRPTAWGVLVFAVIVLVVLGGIRFAAEAGRRSVESTTAPAPATADAALADAGAPVGAEGPSGD